MDGGGHAAVHGSTGAAVFGIMGGILFFLYALTSPRGPVQRSILLVLILLFMTAPGASAQRYAVRTYTQSDGLPNSLVWDALQDASGRMWFATRTGIAVYDGLEWWRYHQADGLARPEQSHLVLDDFGVLWSAGPGSGLISRFDGQAWSVLPSIPPQEGPPLQIHSLATLVQGRTTHLAVGTEGHGLFLWDGVAWRRYGPAEGLPGRVLALAVDREGFLVGTTEGLFRLREERLARVPLDTPSVAVRGLAVEPLADGGERLWIAGRAWIATLEEGALRLRAEALDLSFLPFSPRLILEPDRHGGLFFGNAVGLARLDGMGRLETLDPASGLVTQGITSLCLDREQHLWVGTGRGVSKIVSFRFANYDAEHGLLTDEVTAVLERASGEMVLGHQQGLTLLGPQGPVQVALRFPGAPPAPHQRVLDLAEDREGNLWVAGGAMQLCRIDPTGAIRWFGADEGFPRGVLVLADRAGTLWAGSNKHLYRREGDRWILALSHAGLRRLFEGRDGTLYLATEGTGVYIGRREEETGAAIAWSPVPKIDEENVFAFLEDRQGRIWFGTASGLFRLGEEGAERVAADGPATDRPVYFLVQDSQDRLWVGTDNGVLRWDGEHREHFGVEEGLSGRETNRAAGVVDSRGRLWIGTDQGVSVYRDEYDYPGLPPKVEWGALLAGGKPRAVGAPIALAPDENDVVFRFRAISFQDEERVRFRSWLEGFEADWTAAYASPLQEVRYTNLAPGKYRFHLRAASAEGAWSNPLSSDWITIAPPIWRRPWFYLSLGLLIALALLGVQRYFAERRYSARLESEVERRTEELATLSREKADFLAISAHDLRVPLVNLRGFAAEAGASLVELTEVLEPVLEQLPEDDRRHTRALLQGDLPEELAFIDSSAARMDRLVTAILQLSRLERRELIYAPVDTEALVEIVLESLTYRLEQHPATVERGELPVVVADPMAMELVLQNLLSNAVAYLEPGRPGRIAVRGRRTADEVIFEVADNGRGICVEDQPKVFQIFGRAGCTNTEGQGMGLAYVRTLLRRHGGRVWFESTVGQGTVFYFALPTV